VVIRTRVGDGPYGGHPQDYSVWFAYVPGLKVVMPGTPTDAKGLMLAAIRDENPVLYVEPMSLAHGPREDVPAEEYLVPIGKARVAREGTDLTIVTIGSTVPVALRAATLLEDEGVDAEVIDLRTLAPLDADTIVASVRKTGGLVTVHESWVSYGIGAEVAAICAERALEDLLAPVKRVGTKPVPVPSGAVRRHALPTAEDVVVAARELLAGSAK
jgi:pyruvate/2-oxoglutarate/acetoin dehydrogenase E1 component